MNYLSKHKLCLEVESTLLKLNGITSVYYFLNKFFIYTERFQEVESAIKTLFQNITNNLNTNLSYELIRTHAGKLMYNK